jgi:GTP 3',8-cyclase
MTEKLVDSFGRVVDYIRISVTDRCDFRCVYCMAEEMTFLPRAQVLTLEEIHTIAAAFTSLGVSKIRLTGGEPLVRRGIEGLCAELASLPGLDELVMTTNGSQLTEKAELLKLAGVKRLNVSLDSLQAERFKQITRTGDLHKVVAGIDAALNAGFENLKINAVILRNRNDDEILDLVEFARTRKIDLSFIEEMPLGAITEHDRAQAYMSSDDIKAVISTRYTLLDSSRQTPGPSRYFAFADGQQSRIGFISPHSHNFCDACNRVRVTAEGRLLLCLGNEHSVDLKAILRRYPGDMSRVQQAIRDAMKLKPARHYFNVADEVKILRFMNMTGG